MEDEWQWILSRLVDEITKCRVEYHMLAIRWEVAYDAAEFDGWLILSLEDAMYDVRDRIYRLQREINGVLDILEKVQGS